MANAVITFSFNICILSCFVFFFKFTEQRARAYVEGGVMFARKVIMAKTSWVDELTKMCESALFCRVSPLNQRMRCVQVESDWRGCDCSGTVGH